MLDRLNEKEVARSHFDTLVAMKVSELTAIDVRNGKIPDLEAIKEMARCIVEAENKRNNRIDVRVLNWIKKQFRRLLGPRSY